VKKILHFRFVFFSEDKVFATYVEIFKGRFLVNENKNLYKMKIILYISYKLFLTISK